MTAFDEDYDANAGNPSTPNINWIDVTSTSVNINVTAGQNTSHIQFDRSWVDNGGGSNDREEYCPSGSTITVSFTVPSTPGTYTIYVRARIDSTASSWVSRSFTIAAPPDPEPYIHGLSFTANNLLEVSFSVGNSAYLRNSNSIAVYLSGANNTTQHFQGYLSSSSRYWSGSRDGAGSPLVVGATYTIWVFAYNTSGASSGTSDSAKYTKPRPADFTWTNSKTSGAAYNLTAAEWGALLDRINEFRAYKGLVTRDFNRSTTSGIINNYVVPLASSFNMARNAILDMNPSVPSLVTSNTIISASQLNELVRALNNIT
ncbi:hypothetical protein [Sporosarcina highlanderae]|uniref:Fibronectin type-III domain-containing protein n=1 Tax=Sporosarcina highlanderae TaxID=3035916 RepID=A0ABT8JVA8_9BACL|nr:hypothetical protein [Sporosarcina highlanderae]MDN4609116.1 hypothetical protein [Sporosarcina highlanderae]